MPELGRIGMGHGQYAIDLRVHVAHTYGFQKKIHPALWPWMQLTVAGNSVHVARANGQVVTVAPAAKCSLKEMDGHCYLLYRQGLSAIHVFCPSQTVWSAFVRAMSVAFHHTSTVPVKPAPVSDVWTSVIAVAATIVETAKAYLNHPCDPVVQTTSVTVADVVAYLAEMKTFYDEILMRQGPEHVYERLLDMEEAYVERGERNFALAFHKLDSRQVQTAEDAAPRRSVKAALWVCPHDKCRAVLTMTERFHIHMRLDSVSCRQCFRTISLDTFKLAAWRRQHDTQAHSSKFAMPSIPPNGSIATFLKHVQAKLEAMVAPPTVVMPVAAAVTKLSDSYSQPIGSSDVDLVRAMAHEVDFVAKVCENYAYWRHPLVVEAAIARFHNFMHLKGTNQASGTGLVPTTDIALVWRAYRANARGNRQVCESVALTELYDDAPGGTSRVGDLAATCCLWERVFHGEAYTSYGSTVADASASNAPPKTTVCLPTTPIAADSFRIPSHDSRFVGVGERLPRLEGRAGRGNDGGRRAFLAVIGTPEKVNTKMLHPCVNSWRDDIVDQDAADLRATKLAFDRFRTWYLQVYRFSMTKTTKVPS